MFDVLLTDLSKVLGRLSHKLLPQKLRAYGVDVSTVRFIYDYFTVLKQRAKIEDDYSSSRDLIFGFT